VARILHQIRSDLSKVPINGITVHVGTGPNLSGKSAYRARLRLAIVPVDVSAA